MTHRYSAIVVDNNLPRCKCLAELALASGCDYVIFAMLNRSSILGADGYRPVPRDRLPMGFDLALRHYRQEAWDLPGLTRVTVWYGAEGAEGDPDRPWNIIRPVRGSSVDITVDDMKELLGWAASPDPASEPRPLLLRPQVRDGCLIALAALCQGYLAARYADPNCASDPMRDLLVRIGWVAYASSPDGAATVAEATAILAQMRDPKTWHRALQDMSREQAFRLAVEEWSAWSRSPLAAEVSALIELAFGPAPIEDAELVGRAYEALAALSL